MAMGTSIITGLSEHISNLVILRQVMELILVMPRKELGTYTEQLDIMLFVPF
jgi:hypothetical protein